MSRYEIHIVCSPDDGGYYASRSSDWATSAVIYATQDELIEALADGTHRWEVDTP